MRKFFFFLVIAASAISCSKENPRPRLTKLDYIAYTNSTIPFEGENLENETWKSDYPFVATITTNNCMSANKVGKAVITNGTWVVNLTVQAKHSLFEKKQNENALNVPFANGTIQMETYMNSCDCEEPIYYNDGHYAAYKLNDSNVGAIAFHYNEGWNMDYFALSVNPQKSGLLDDWLKERYSPVPPELDYDDAYCHYKKDGNPDLLLYVTRKSNIITVIFMPTSTKSNGNTHEEIFNFLEYVS